MSEHPPPPSQKKLRFRHYFLFLAFPLIIWRAYADRDYWSDVWKQKTISPTATSEIGSAFKHYQARKQQPLPFDLSNLTIPRSEIYAGGPPKDGIPALTNPKLIPAAEATYLAPTDRIIGLANDLEARAYPLRILNYHEIVNDRLANIPIAITYCPLCDSCAAFDRRTTQGETEFGVSGLLYNSNVLMFDRTGKLAALWSQLAKKAISGPTADDRLTALPLELTNWQNWQSQHPNTLVLTTETGHQRDYNHNPYADYFETPRLMFPAQPTDDRLPVKQRILAVWTDQAARAYPLSAFNTEHTELEDSLDGKNFTLIYKPDSDSLRVSSADEGIQWLYSLWFAWYAMQPDTEIYTP